MIAVGSSKPAAHPEWLPNSIGAINAELEKMGSPLLLTEESLERCWVRALELKEDCASTWLLLVRLAEAALLCAGNYADHCEFRAAGDLLVNPREIIVRPRCSGRAIIKDRHGRLTEQLAFASAHPFETQKRPSTAFDLEVTRMPLLPHMTQILKESGRVARCYIRRLEEGQIKVADTLSFLSAWQIVDSADLWRRLTATPTPDRAFVESRLCRFDMRIFERIGADLTQSLMDPNGLSPFLSPPRGGDVWLNRLPLRELVARLT